MALCVTATAVNETQECAVHPGRQRGHLDPPPRVCPKPHVPFSHMGNSTSVQMVSEKTPRAGEVSARGAGNTRLNESRGYLRI